MEIAIRHKTRWRGLRLRTGLRVRKSVPRRRQQRKRPRSRSTIAAPRYRGIRRGIRHSALIPANHRNRVRSCVSTSPADRLRLTTLPSLSTSSIVGRVRIAQGVDQWAVEPARVIQLRPTDGVLLR